MSSAAVVIGALKVNFFLFFTQMHWNNPQIRDDYTDSSGMTFFLTPNLRTYEAGVMTVGQSYLEIPPHQTSYSTEGRCKGSCTPQIMEGPIYITSSFNHMHYLGKKLIEANETTGPRSAVRDVSGNRCESDCISRGREFDLGLVPYFRGD